MGKKEEIINAINETFKGLEFNYMEYNDTFDAYDIHFKGGKYFHLSVELDAGIRQTITPKKKIIKCQRCGKILHEDRLEYIFCLDCESKKIKY